MATTFYLPLSNPDPALNIGAMRAAWDASLAITSQRMVTDKTGFADDVSASAALVSKTVGTGVNPNTQGFRQYLSAPLAAQTISGTAGMLMKCSEQDSTVKAKASTRLLVVSSLGALKATLLTVSPAASYNNATVLNRRFIVVGTALASFACADGDRLCLETGAYIAATVTGVWAGINFGANAAKPDLPDSETANTDANGWLTLSATIAFLGAGGPGSRGKQSPMVFG
ncbi:MAG: hypothetical protein U0869_10540 [Chloroflexota bacterium]